VILQQEALMGVRDWAKQRIEVATEHTRQAVTGLSDTVSRQDSDTPPAFPPADPDTLGKITERGWSDRPGAPVSVVWRRVERGGTGGRPTWFGDIVDPNTYEKVDVFHDYDEAWRRRTVLFAVAGAHYRRSVLDRPEFAAGHPVTLRPDPRNKHDSRAIEVRDASRKQVVGFVPADRPGESFAQGLLHAWMAEEPVVGLVCSERAWVTDDGQITSRRGGITVLAGPRIQCMRIPERGDADYDDFAASRLHAKAERWPKRRMSLRRAIDRADDLAGRHFAVGELISAAYRLRDAHPEALADAIAACREQIDLAPRVAPLLRQRWGDLPEHRGYKQLAIVLERQKEFAEAAALVEQARNQGWAGDWDARLQRLERKSS
jgi:hypothetical protein